MRVVPEINATDVNCLKCGKELHPDERIVCTSCGTPVPRSFTDAPELFPERRQILRGPILAVAILVIAIFVLAPMALGFRARAAYQATVEQIAASGITAKVLSYHQGWFFSSAKLEVGTSAIQTVLDESIAHGPYPLWSGWFSLMPVAAVVDSRPGATGPNGAPSILPADLKIRTVVYMNGRNRTRLTMPPRTISHGMGGVNFLGLEGEVIPLDNRLRVVLQSPGFIGSGLLSWSVGDLTFRGDWHRPDNGIWIGTTEYTIREINVSAPGGRGVNFELIQRDGADSLENGMLKLQGTIRISSAVLGSERVGNIALAWQVKKIDPNAIQTWSKHVQALQNTKPDKQALTAQAQAGLHDFVMALAAGGPQLDSDFTMSTSDGPVTANLNLSIMPDKSSAGAAQAPVDAAPMTIVKDRMFGEATVHAPRTLVDRVAGATRVADWIQNHLLIKDKSKYELKADFAGGKLMVNGKQVLDITNLPPLPKPPAITPGATPPRDSAGLNDRRKIQGFRGLTYGDRWGTPPQLTGLFGP